MKYILDTYKVPILITTLAITATVFSFNQIFRRKIKESSNNQNNGTDENEEIDNSNLIDNLIDKEKISEYDLTALVQSIYQCLNNNSNDNLENHMDIIVDKVLSIITDIYKPEIINIEVLSGDQSKYYNSKTLSQEALQITKELAKISLESNKLIFIDDCSYIPRFYSTESENIVKNIICCPLYVQEKLFGLIYLINSSIILSENIKIFETIINNFTMALDKSIIYYKCMLEQKKLNAILSIVRIRSADKSLSHLLEVAVEEITKVINSEFTSIYLCDNNRKEIFICSSCDGMEGLTISYGQGLAGYVAETAQSVRIENAYTDDRFLPVVDKFTGKKSKSILCVPIPGFSSNNPIALIQGMNKINGLHFTSYDEEMLISIAKELSIALHLRAREIYELKTTLRDNPKYDIISQAVLEASLLQEYGSMAYRYKYRVANDKIIHGVSGEKINNKHDDTISYSSNRSTAESNDSIVANEISPEISYDFTSDLINNQSYEIPNDNMETSNINGKYSYQEAMNLINDYNLDPFLISNDNLIELSIFMFESYNLLSKYKIDVNILYKYLTIVCSNYHSIHPFHNFKHGFGVMHITYNILRYGNIDKYLLDKDILSLLIASICHDIDHTGHNNSFEIASRSKLAILYSDDMVLERHHAATTNKLLMNPEIDFLKNLSKDDKIYVRKQITSAIFGTDMSKHFEMVEQLTTHISLNPCFNIDDTADRTKLCRYVLHSADIGAQTQNEILSTKWTNCCIQEFYNQSVLEQQLKLEVTPYMVDLIHDEYKAMSLQNGFINDIVLPLWLSLKQCFPLLESQVASLIKNKDRYANRMNELVEIETYNCKTNNVCVDMNESRDRGLSIINEYCITGDSDYPSPRMTSNFGLKNRSLSDDDLYNTITTKSGSASPNTINNKISLPRTPLSKARSYSSDEKLTSRKSSNSEDVSPLFHPQRIRSKSGNS